MNKGTVVYSFNAILLSNTKKKKNRLVVHATTCINFENIMLNKRYQIPKIDFIYMLTYNRKNKIIIIKIKTVDASQVQS